MLNSILRGCNMFYLFGLEERENWELWMDKFSDIDIYYSPGYCEIYQKNNEGIAKLFVYEDESGYVYYPFLMREINELEVGKNLKEKYYDIITPYGYGGPIHALKEEGNLEGLKKNFFNAFEAFCVQNNIVSEFVRFHPLIKNHLFSNEFLNPVAIRSTIYMDIENEDRIWSNIISKNRNMIRKAEKNGISVEQNDNLEKFEELYYQTMDKNQATEYYYFNHEYFTSTMKNLKDNIKIFNAVLDGKVIASTMIMFKNKYMHYHLSGSDREYIKLAPNNLLLYKVALWGMDNGFKYFHLGGGYRGNDDSLFSFKKSFSKEGILDFYIGKKIHNSEIYNLLVEELKCLEDNDFEDNGFFPLYRR